MHRAEKASSKLCRDREVEKAQELHRRKIDGVKSYLTAITRPPVPSISALSNKVPRSSTFFRRSLRQHVSVPKTSSEIDGQSSHAMKPNVAEDSGDKSSDGDRSANSSDDDSSYDPSPEGEPGNGDEVATKSFGKLDELRSVLVPVMAYKDHKHHPTDLDYEQFLDAITHPVPPPQEPPKPTPFQHSSHSLRASAFRMRRLKQIETDNATIFERIKKSTAHYRTETFKKDWDQNVAYLTSICEFPVVPEAVHAPPVVRRHSHARKRSPFTTRPPEHLPSLQLDVPPVVHPIRAIPTSPTKGTSLNLSPGFRSLRKGLPQVPALPPLTASPRVVHPSKSKSMTAVAGSRTFLQTEESSLPRRSPSPPLKRTTSIDSTEDVAADPSRYTLLKIGRFLGGKYLILTVFCGDGITNPYGFDVVALDPEAHVEFNLSITKETTHLLLETISSSSMAERTAAAAGTNLSMELIARCICDHIRYARTGNSEVVFLVATAGHPGGLSGDASGGPDGKPTPNSAPLPDSHRPNLLVDTVFMAMAFCVYQFVSVPVLPASDSECGGCFHVFASTRPPQCCRASMHDVAAFPAIQAQPFDTDTGGLVVFEVRQDCESHGTRAPITPLQVGISDLIHKFDAERIVVESATRDRLSLDRVLMLALQFLHFVSPREGSTGLQLAFTPSQPNDWTSAVRSPRRSPCHRPSSSVLSSQLVSTIESSPSSLSTHDQLTTVLQTGMLWRGAYLVARVALLAPGHIDVATGEVSREPRDELLALNMLNTSTGKYSERVLPGDQVEEFSQKLGAWQATAGTVPPLVVFAKLLLRRIRLDVDLRGHEIIRFPTLEPRYHNAGTASSPVASSSRRNSPVKHVSNDDKKANDGDSETTKHWLELELHKHSKAARTIQGLARRFLRRRRQGNMVSGSSLSDESLPALLLAFMRNRAAKRIQFMSRNYTNRTARRRRAHDLDGIMMTTPRALTPTATLKSRTSGTVGTHTTPGHAPHVDEGVATPRVTVALTDADSLATDSDGSESEDDDEGRSKHIDMLGVLEEDEQEEEQSDGSPKQLPENPAIASRTESQYDGASCDDEPRNDVASSLRVGKKIASQFVLERHVLCPPDSQMKVLEYGIIGTLGELRSEK